MNKLTLFLACGIFLCADVALVLATQFTQDRTRFEFHNGNRTQTLPFTGLPTATGDCVSVQVMIWGDFGSSANYCTGKFGSISINSNTVFDLNGIGGVNTDSSIPADGKLLRFDGDTKCNFGFWFTYIFQIDKDDFNS